MCYRTILEFYNAFFNPTERICALFQMVFEDRSFFRDKTTDCISGVMFTFLPRW